MTKAQLRRQKLQERVLLSAEQMKEASQAICTQLLNSFSFTGFRGVHIFLPLPEKNELDTWPIIRRIWEEFPQIRIAVPVMVSSSDMLTHRLLTPQTRLFRNSWGIPEPSLQEPAVPEQELDLVVLPLLAFDLTGQRLGYGKGFYDRFLTQCKPDVLKVGVSVFGPVEAIPEVNEHDIPLDYCITPEKAWVFTKG